MTSLLSKKTRQMTFFWWLKLQIKVSKKLHFNLVTYDFLSYTIIKQRESNSSRLASSTVRMCNKKTLKLSLLVCWVGPSVCESLYALCWSRCVWPASYSKWHFKPFSCHSAKQWHGVDDYHPPMGVLVRPTGAVPVNKGPAMSGGWGWLTG